MKGRYKFLCSGIGKGRLVCDMRMKGRYKLLRCVQQEGNFVCDKRMEGSYKSNNTRQLPCI